MDLGAPVERMVHCVSRRTVVLAELEDGRHVVVKWPDGSLDLTIDREVMVVRVLESSVVPEWTRRALPRLLRVDDPSRISVYDALEPCVSLRDLLDGGRLSTTHIDALARALAGLHSAVHPPHVFDSPDLHTTVPAPRSTLLTPHEYAYGVGAEFDTWIRAMQRLRDQFEEIHRGWHPSALIHFDLRDDNVLFGAGTNSGTVRIIDWEFAAVGDPRYDIGYVAAQFVLSAMRGRGFDGPRPALPSWVMRAVGRFLSAYHEVVPVSHDDELDVVRYAGLVLVQQAGSRLELFGSLGHIGHLCLLVAEGLVRRPEYLVSRLPERVEGRS